ncbi:MAG: PQQ-binding-like beta-propeller repeat protein [Flavobacteriales bacterium]|nr:PQQ-binding-like beta-propeller repeat protein [Flavobacteriales bacterium]
MRRSIILLALLPTLLFAQKEFPKVWEAKFSVEAKWKIRTPDNAYVIGGNMAEIEMLDGATGKSLWVYNFKEKNGVTKCEDWITQHESETIEVTIRKKGKDSPIEMFHLDYRTGEVVGESTLTARETAHKQARVKTPRVKGMRKRMSGSSCYDEATNTTIDLGYDRKNLMSAGKGSDLNITVDASGANSWSTSFTGRVVRHLCSNMLPADDGEVILKVSSGFGKVFVVYEGITCIDIATGKILWNSTFDNVEISSGLRVTQEIGRSAMPLPAADGVYICDFSKGERTIKKLDLNTGAVVWQADKLSKNDIVSELLVDGGNLIAHFGGLIRVERYIPGSNGTADTYKVEYSFEGSTSVRAYSAATGKPAWNTEDMDLPDNFKKSECSMMSVTGQVLACGEKNLYVFEAATGKLLKQAEYNAKVLGKAKSLYPFDGNYMIEGEKGIGCMKPDGTMIYATNTGKCLMTEMRGDAFIVWTGKDLDDRKEFLRFDPLTGAITGTMEDCPHPYFNNTGDLFLRFDGQKVMQYRTN